MRKYPHVKIYSPVVVGHPVYDMYRVINLILKFVELKKNDPCKSYSNFSRDLSGLVLNAMLYQNFYRSKMLRYCTIPEKKQF